MYKELFLKLDAYIHSYELLAWELTIILNFPVVYFGNFSVK